MTKTWIATFGGNHTHPLTGDSLRDSYCRVPGETYIAAHDLMIMSAFGRHWAFLYEHPDLPGGADDQKDGVGCAAGVERFGLVEVAFLPPSPVATALWAAYPKGRTDDPEWWADKVVQPAEVAHLLAMSRLGRNIEAVPDDEPAEAEVGAPPPTGAIDLMAALQASMKRARAARDTGSAAADPEPADAT